MIQSHLKLAHHYWKAFLNPGDHVVDATCGNGYDSLALAQIVLTRLEGHLFCIDIQEKALEATKSLLKKNLSFSQVEKISYYLGCHSSFPLFSTPPRLIVYNLGYLPRSDKTVTTQTLSTLKSLKKALEHLTLGGMVSMTCYSGHEEGEKEAKAVLSFAKSLNSNSYQVCYHQWLNRLKSPSLLLIYKNNSMTSKPLV